MSIRTRQSQILPPLWVLTLLFAALICWLAYELKEILVLIVVGYAIAYAVEPIIQWFEEVGVRRKFGIVLVFVLAFLGIFLLVSTAIPTIVREADNLSSNFPAYVAEAKERAVKLFLSLELPVPERLSKAEVLEKLKGSLPSVGKDALQSIGTAAYAAVMRGYSLTLTIVNFFLLPFIVFYISTDFQGMHRRALLFFPVLKRGKVERLAKQINGYVAAFVRGQLLVGAILAVLYGIGLKLVGVELWFLLAVISGFGNIIPYLGFAIGILLSSVMALVTFGDFQHLFLVWAVYAVVQALEGTLITPKILGDSVGLSPLTIILALVAGGTLFGLLGIFLAVPGTAALKVLLSSLHDWYMEKV